MKASSAFLYVSSRTSVRADQPARALRAHRLFTPVGARLRLSSSHVLGRLHAALQGARECRKSGRDAPHASHFCASWPCPGRSEVVETAAAPAAAGERGRGAPLRMRVRCGGYDFPPTGRPRRRRLVPERVSCSCPLVRLRRFSPFHEKGVVKLAAREWSSAGLVMSGPMLSTPALTALSSRPMRTGTRRAAEGH